MVRLLFVMNEHPNEAFAISSARKTAKELQVQGFTLYVEGRDKIPKKPEGNEIILVKVRAKDTLLGRAIKGLPLETKRQRESGADVQWYWTMRVGEKMRAAKAKKYGVDAIYNWHCAPQGDKIYFKTGRADFDIRTYIGGANKKQVPTRVIELKTQQKKIPERVMRHVRKRAEPKLRTPLVRYLTHTTSHKLTTEAGLTPKAFGKRLARQILKEVKAIESRQTLKKVRGRIPRVRPKGVKKRKALRRVRR